MTGKTASRAEYARMRGVTRQAVDAAVKSGRIADAVTDNGKLDVALADELWAANTNPVRGDHLRIRKTRKNTQEELIEAAMEIGVDPDALPSISESQTLKLAYQAKLAQLEYEEKTAKLVDAEDMKKRAFRVARVTRDAMMAIPDRVAAEFAGMTDAFAIHGKLTDEIRAAISEVVKAIGDE
jgi:hypothetical protein